MRTDLQLHSWSGTFHKVCSCTVW